MKQIQYLYHHLPNEMQGNILYPLNVLKSHLPAVYRKEVAKYQGREWVTEQRIPVLGDCSWNDVLFLTATHPQELFDARRAAGWADIASQTYLRIDPRKLDAAKLGVFLFTQHRDGGKKTKSTDEDFVQYRNSDLSSYAIVPQETKDYFLEERLKGAPRIQLFYRYIPHILYRGPIDVSIGDKVVVR